MGGEKEDISGKSVVDKGVAQNREKVAATDATCSMAKKITHQSCHRVKRCTLRLIASEAANGTSSNPHFLLALTAEAAGKPATAHPESTRG
jgi:hypothetical protein